MLIGRHSRSRIESRVSGLRLRSRSDNSKRPLTLAHGSEEVTIEGAGGMEVPRRSRSWIEISRGERGGIPFQETLTRATLTGSSLELSV